MDAAALEWNSDSSQRSSCCLTLGSTPSLVRILREQAAFPAAMEEPGCATGQRQARGDILNVAEGVAEAS